MKADFYAAVYEDNAVDINAALAAIFELPLARRNMGRDNGPYRLQEFALAANRMAEGDICQTRLDRGVSFARANTPPQPHPLAADEGATESQAFIFNRRLNVLVLERNVNAGTCRTLADYINVAGQLPRRIDFVPMLKAEAYARIMGMHEYKRIEISVAQPQNLRALGNNDQAIVNLARATHELGAGMMKLSLSCGHTRRPLTLRAARDFINTLFNQGGADAQVNKIFVAGKDQDDVPDALDLFKFKLTDRIDVPAGQYRQTPYEDRIAALRAILHRNMREVNDILHRAE